jgi:hypothetical protein
MGSFQDLSLCLQWQVAFAAATSSISIVGGILILISFYVIPKIRTNAFSLLFAMTVADICSRIFFIAYVNPAVDGSVACDVQASFTQVTFSKLVYTVLSYFKLLIKFYCYTSISVFHNAGDVAIRNRGMAYVFPHHEKGTLNAREYSVDCDYYKSGFSSLCLYSVFHTTVWTVGCVLLD